MTAHGHIAYFDSSIILRYVIGHEHAIKDLSLYAAGEITRALLSLNAHGS